jgi:hypothetical protein
MLRAGGPAPELVGSIEETVLGMTSNPDQLKRRLQTEEVEK